VDLRGGGMKEEKGVFMVKNKIIPAGSIVHIIQRAPGKEILFLEKNDYLYFLHILKEIGKKHRVIVFAFCLMPNHFHLLVKFLQDNASLAIKNLCEKYAIFLNLKYSRKGHVFYGRYRAALCFDEAYFLASSLYIHINPVIAKLSKSFIYRWSSSALYITDFNKKTFIDYEPILSLLSKDLKKARKQYCELLAVSLRRKIENPWEKPYGLRVFRAEMLSMFYKKFNMAKIKNNYLLSDFNIEKEIASLRNKKRMKTPQELKAKFYVIEQLLRRGYSCEEVGVRLGMTASGVYKIIRKSTSEACPLEWT
jgi:REP element-mobilizing transposase RayT/DNA-binding CsgD family transcriptional regulator